MHRRTEPRDRTRARALLGVLATAALWLAAAAGCAASARGPLAALLAADPGETVFLTWHGDPLTTMTVHWLAPRGGSDGQVVYGPTGEAASAVATGTRRTLPGGELDLHEVRLAGLEPGATYEFCIAGSSRLCRFRTMPASADDPITFVDGGDVYREAIDEAMYRTAAGCDPMFAVVGGDIVYDNGDPDGADRWLEWLRAWSRLMVAPDGRAVPLLAAIGNHEVAGQFGRSPRDAPLYYSIFVPPGASSHRVVDIGGYMSIVLLDSGHTQEVAAQSSWLGEALAERPGVPHLFAVYHVPAWPSVRSFDGDVSREIRREWVPLFERYGVDVAFEHHDHAYKRTHPIREGRVDPAGVLYFGDGAWGVPPRDVHSAESTWYLARSQAVQNVIVTTIDGDRRTHRAVAPDGTLIDSWP